MSELSTFSLASVQPSPVIWLWPGRIPRGKLTMLCGDPGLGKSFVTMDLAARVTNGRAWPDEPERASMAASSSPGSVLILSAEDDAADTIRPRLEASGGDPARVEIVQGIARAGKTIGLALDVDVAAIEAHVSAMKRPRLVVIDPISAYMGGADTHCNAQVRGVLAELAGLAMRTGVAVVCVSHLSKNQGTKAVYRQTGSLAFTAAARMVWQVAKMPGAAPDDATRAMVLVKSNIETKRNGLTFRVSDGRIEWLSSDLVLDADAIESPEAAQMHEAVPEATEFLRSLLAAGPMAAGSVIERARQAGISVITLKRAKKTAKVIARRATTGGLDRPWVWHLEDHHPGPVDDPLSAAPGSVDRGDAS